MNISPELLTILMFVGLFVGLFLGHPLAFVLGGLAVIFGIIGIGPGILPAFAIRIYSLMSEWILVAVPLFILMANFLERTGIAEDLFKAVRYLFGPLRGGMAATVVLVCTLLAACTGIVGTGIVTAGLIAIGPMLRYGYQKELTTGVVGAGGSLGILIPPSIMLVFMGAMAGLSVGKLFAGAIFPGLILSSLYVVYLLTRAYLQPGLAPALSLEERKAVPVRKRLTMSLKSVVPPIGLIFAVLGSIIFGVATPTEAAGVGAFIALLMTFAYRRFTWRGLKEAVINTAKTTSMVLVIAIGAGCFSTTVLLNGGGGVIRDLILGLEMGKWGAFAIMMLVIFAFGCFIDWIGIIFITFPIFLPIASHFGFDPLWFVLMIAVLLQTCFLTPPFGYALFYLKGIVPEGVEMGHIYRGVFPFVLLQLCGVVLCVIFPQLILWLPTVLVK